ncbi:hypothetical protein BS50DRAFT_207317 [Corynespora cassiicola Philippines]|uniref:Uncharacterized protein n=1 Tax=Corynespora cassiicola Philippines TaxID=1448308 RepID=A0A2T2N4G8_CORCC|nr:hypothetical protein BS50DRAFT_207317 [Corynespora cassiicola Philippines]
MPNLTWYSSRMRGYALSLSLSLSLSLCFSHFQICPQLISAHLRISISRSASLSIPPSRTHAPRLNITQKTSLLPSPPFSPGAMFSLEARTFPLLRSNHLIAGSSLSLSLPLSLFAAPIVFVPFFRAVGIARGGFGGRAWTFWPTAPPDQGKLWRRSICVCGLISALA